MSDLDEQELISTRILNGSISKKETIKLINDLIISNKELDKECSRLEKKEKDMEELINQMKSFLLKNHLMCDFLEGEKY